MNFKLSNITFQSEIGYVMTFDIYFPDVGVKICRAVLVRPDQSPDNTWLQFQKAEGGALACQVGPATREKIGQAATGIYNRMRGTNWTFALRPIERERLAEFTEKHDAGLQRVLGEAERDSLDMAGI